MIAVLLALACGLQHHVPRSRTSVHAFMRANPCPGGSDKGSTKRCRGWRVDHRIPLCAGGKDAAENMAWQELAESLEKDQVEVALCKWIFKECGVPWRKEAAKQ